MTSAAPPSGPEAGGTSVQLTGIGFDSATAVEFGSVEAPNFKVDSQTETTATSPAGVGEVDFGSDPASDVVVSPTEITATSPAEPPGIVQVTVTTSGGSSPVTPIDDFTYEQDPNVLALSPAAGTSAGGTSVVISGTDLVDASSVTFGSSPAAFLVNSPSQITATSPPGTGTVDVVVSTPVGTSEIGSSDQFVYEIRRLSTR